MMLFQPISTDWKIQCMDAVRWLEGLADASVDLVVTDPAYESLEKHRAIGTTTRLSSSDASSNEWFPIFKNERFLELFRELYRVLKKGTHCYILCDQETMFVVHDIAPKVGFVWEKFLVWDKVKPGMGYHYRCTHEVICFLSKGKREGKARGCLNDNSTPDILRHARVKGYPTEKPVGLLQDLVRMSSNEGDLVVDPFGGSFSTAEAALVLRRKFAGCDIKESACKLGRERMARLI